MKRITVVLAGAIALELAGCGSRVRTPSIPPPTAPAAVTQVPAEVAELEVTPPRPPLPRPAVVVSDSEMLLVYLDQVRKMSAGELAKESDQVRRQYAKTRTDVTRMRYAILVSASNSQPGDDVRTAELLDPVLKGADTGLRALAYLLSVQFQEQRRAYALQQKLDALMSLDKTMIERGR